jgi:hypothetical protein
MENIYQSCKINLYRWQKNSSYFETETKKIKQSKMRDMETQYNWREEITVFTQMQDDSNLRWSPR